MSVVGCIAKIALVAALFGLTSTAASAMTFTTGPLNGGTAVYGIGLIGPGDRAKLVALMDGLPLQTPAKMLIVNSPGGSVLEAERLANTIHLNRLAVGVAGGDFCVSACFLLFAASPQRFAQVGARIGVHSASIEASETVGTMAATTAMARDAAGYGVPSSIVGRMVTTEPGQVAWLSEGDLQAMGTLLLPPDSGPAVPAPNPVMPIPGQMAAIAPPPAMQPSSAFQQGAADRRAWEAWFAALPPMPHAGALYWSAQRSLRQPGSCNMSPSGLTTDDQFAWSHGCADAQRRLAPFDVRRKAEPEYRAGWNSF